MGRLLGALLLLLDPSSVPAPVLGEAIAREAQMRRAAERIDAGQAARALALLSRIEPPEDAATRGRLRLLEGIALVHLGRRAEAAAAFEAAETAPEAALLRAHLGWYRYLATGEVAFLRSVPSDGRFGYPARAAEIARLRREGRSAEALEEARALVEATLGTWREGAARVLAAECALPGADLRTRRTIAAELRAVALLFRGQRAAARAAALQTRLRVRPGPPPQAWLLPRARRWAQRAHPRRALVELHRIRAILGSHPSHWEVDLLEAQTAVRARRFRRARRLFARVRARAPSATLQAEANNGLALLYGRRSSRRAQAAFEETADRWPDTPAAPTALHHAGRLAWRQGGLDAALRLWQRCEDRYGALPEGAPCTFELAWAALEGGDEGTAAAKLDRLLALKLAPVGSPLDLPPEPPAQAPGEAGSETPATSEGAGPRGEATGEPDGDDPVEEEESGGDEAAGGPGDGSGRAEGVAAGAWVEAPGKAGASGGADGPAGRPAALDATEPDPMEPDPTGSASPETDLAETDPAEAEPPGSDPLAEDETLAEAPTAPVWDLAQRRFRDKVRYWRGRLYARGGDAEAAAALYRQISEAHPYDWYAQLSLALLAALDALPPAQRPGSDPLPAARHPEVQAALAYLRLGMAEESRRTLLALRRDRLDFESRTVAAAVWLALGEPARAHRMAPVPWEGGLPGGLEGRHGVAARLAYPRAFREAVEGPARDPRVPAALVYALIRAESGFDPKARSPAGALGLTQVIRPTARRIARRLGLRRFRFQQLTDPAMAVRIGSAYLGDLLDRYGGSVVLAVAAYNAGEPQVDRWLRARGTEPVDAFVEDIPFAETNRYVRKVLTNWGIYRALYEDAHPPLPLNPETALCRPGETGRPCAHAATR